MTNKPMLSVERELRGAIEQSLLAMKRIYQAGYEGIINAGGSCDQPGVMFENDPTVRELRALLDQPAESVIDLDALDWESVKEAAAESKWMPPEYMRNEWVADVCAFLRSNPAAQNQGEPVAQSEFEPDAICLESDGCPTEGAVLKRFWRENQPDPVLCEFYEAEDFPSLVRELVGHVAQLQEAAKRNVKPWEDTFPPTLLPAYIARINAEQPAPVADHPQCEECKGWGYHENHHEGGGTECGECGGSGNAAVAVVMPEHTMRSVMDAIQQARGFPMLTSNQCHALAESLNYVARLNGVKT